MQSSITFFLQKQSNGRGIQQNQKEEIIISK
jgi:hypothetical protein